MSKEVEVTSFYFANGSTSRCYPLSIKVDDQQISFLKDGLRCLVRKGQEVLQVFSMSDGEQLYRLIFEPTHGTWHLQTRGGQ